MIGIFTRVALFMIGLVGCMGFKIKPNWAFFAGWVLSFIAYKLWPILA